MHTSMLFLCVYTDLYGCDMYFYSYIGLKLLYLGLIDDFDWKHSVNVQLKLSIKGEAMTESDDQPMM